MANVKITELTAYTNPASTDVVPIVDLVNDQTKKVTIADLLENAGSGTAAAPSIAFDGDSDTGIYRPGADQLAISTNGTQRINIEADGDINIDSGGVFYDATNNRLAIGTTSPSRTAHIHAASDCRLKLTNNTTGSGIYDGFEITDVGSIIQWEVDPIRFYTNNGSSVDERMRIDSSGRLLVGTSTARTNFFNTTTIGAGIQAEGTQFNEGSLIAAIRNTNDVTSVPVFLLAKSRGSTVGSNTIVQANDHLGYLSFQGSDGGQFVEAAQIKGEVDGTPGANDMPGRLVFSTCADGASSPTERMRIDNAGNIRVNATQNFPGDSNTGTGIFLERAADGGTVFSSRGSGRSGHFNRNGDGELIRFCRSGTDVGSIDVTTTSTAYNTSSDYRLKENVIDITDGITRVKQLAPKRFNFIADADTTVDGFLAHEAQTVVPEAVTGTHNEVDDDGDPVYQGIDQSKLVPLLTAALQEAIAKIETLETSNADLLARVSALEAS